MLNRLVQDDFWTFLGGKVEFGESTDEAILREYFEETGTNVEVERLVACVENFWISNEVKWYEIFDEVINEAEDLIKKIQVI